MNELAVDAVTAYHQAGHAVVARILQLPIGTINAISDHDSAGHVTIPGHGKILEHWESECARYRSHETAIRARVLAYMAGRKTETAVFGEDSGGDGEDRYQIDLMLNSLLPVSADLVGWEQRLRRICKGLVRRHIRPIQIVASALLNYGRVEVEVVDTILLSSAPTLSGLRSVSA